MAMTRKDFTIVADSLGMSIARAIGTETHGAIRAAVGIAHAFDVTYPRFDFDKFMAHVDKVAIDGFITVPQEH